MSKSVVIRRCATTEEALVVTALLRDGGFLANLDNWHISTIYGGAVAAFGGVGVSVPESQMYDAAEYMIEMAQTADARLKNLFGSLETEPIKRKRWRAILMLVIFAPFEILVLLVAIQLSTLNTSNGAIPSTNSN